MVFFGERPDRFPGVRVAEATVRSYLYGDLATHVLGWVGSINDRELRNRRPPTGKEYRLRDQIGKAGVELMFEDDLRGVAGRKVVEVDRLAFSPGDLVMFRGRNAMHRVTPTEGAVTRMLVVFAFNDRPEIGLSDSALQTFYGRTT